MDGGVEGETGCQSLSLFVSGSMLICHALAVYLCALLPNDPLYLSISVTAYAWFGAALSLLGLIGGIRVRFPLSRSSHERLVVYKMLNV